MRRRSPRRNVTPCRSKFENLDRHLATAAEHGRETGRRELPSGSLPQDRGQSRRFRPARRAGRSDRARPRAPSPCGRELHQPTDFRFRFVSMPAISRTLGGWNRSDRDQRLDLQPQRLLLRRETHFMARKPHPGAVESQFADRARPRRTAAKAGAGRRGSVEAAAFPSRCPAYPGCQRGKPPAFGQGTFERRPALWQKHEQHLADGNADQPEALDQLSGLVVAKCPVAREILGRDSGAACRATRRRPVQGPGWRMLRAGQVVPVCRHLRLVWTTGYWRTRWPVS